MKILSKNASLFAGVLLLAGHAVAAPPESAANGQIYQEGDKVQVWSDQQTGWVSPERFWLDYARAGSGRYWGRGSEYPEYSEVSEHDTLMIDVDGGPCLMYFFHERWRRAQDVRRWDPAFNEILGCPSVFD